MADRSTALLVARAEAKERERTAEDAAVRAQLDAILDDLGAEEVRVLGLLARRLLEGQHVYGHLDLGNDPRDLEAERGNEVSDLLIYSAMLELQRMLRAGKGGG